MEAIHVLLDINGTSIPLEIASSVNKYTDINSKVVSEKELPDNVPDTISSKHILSNECGFENYRELIDKIGDDFDIIHTHHIGPAVKAGYRTLNYPIHHVNTQHGHSHYTYEEKLKNIPALLFADTIVFNSQETAESYNFVEDLCKLASDEHIVYNGINSEKLKSHRANILEPETVITAARLIPRKNIGTLIRAFTHVDGLTLKIVGDGPQRRKLEELSRRKNVSERIDFLGYLPKRNDVYKELAKADIFAFPSHGEGFCVALAEAMAVGLPVVISDLEIFHEVAGENGVFIDQNSPKTISNALINLQRNPDTARRLGEMNRQRVLKNFTLEKCANGYGNVYEKCIKNNRKYNHSDI